MEPVLIYTDSQHVDSGAIQTFEMDLAFGADEQDFEIAFSKPVLAGGELLYIDGTEYGGIIDSVTQSTETDVTVYKGRTWHGMLAGKVVKPPANQDYYTLSGDANTCIRSLLSYVGLNTVLTGRSTASGITISSYKFDRFTNAYSGLLRMLNSADAVLRIERHDGITELWAEQRATISDEADSDIMDFSITDSYRVPNHLVCTGEGELQDRVVVDLYADASGNVSTTQTLTGVDEIAVLYNYNNADAAELTTKGTIELRKYQQGGGADISVNSRGDWHIGDKLQVRDNRTGTVIVSTIAKKIVKVENGVLSVEYEVGDASAQAYGGGGDAETNLVTPIANGGTGATTASGALANLGALPLSGGVMTGIITSKSSTINEDAAAPTETQYTQFAEVQDKDGTVISHYEVFQQANTSVIGHNFAAVRRTVNGTRTWYQCSMRVAPNGTVSYVIHSPSAFCSALNVGDREASDQSANVSVANNTQVNICSVTLSAGVWIICGNIQFSSNATGGRMCVLSANSGDASSVDQRQHAIRVPADTSGPTRLNVSATKSLTASTTYYLKAYQQSGSTLTVTGCITAVRIK